MKEVVFWLRDFVKLDFNWKSYLAVSLWIAAWIGLNYTIDLENKVIDQYAATINHFYGYLALYTVVYAGAVGLSAIFSKDREYLKKGSFYIRSVVGLVLLSADRSFYLYDIIAKWQPDYDLMVFYTKVANQYFSTVMTIIVLGPFYLVSKDYIKMNFYGLAGRNLHIRPYWYMLLIMIPIVLIAAFTSGFIAYYPVFKFWTAVEKMHQPAWMTICTYEIAYLSNFIQVEMLFRGFFILGVGAISGRAAILPMVAIYAALHFGKPVGETISSIFGGYILGILAYKSRNIYGGIFIHMGVALLMELASFGVKYYLMK
jgi:hypothetical protein